MLRRFRVVARWCFGYRCPLTNPPLPPFQKAISLSSWGLMLLLALIWGGSFTANRAALAGVGAAGMLTASVLVTAPLALWQDGVPTLDYRPQVWGALAYLALVVSAFAYMIFYRILSRAGAGNLGLVTLLIAPVAIIFGALAFGESLSPHAYAGFALLTAGMLVMDGRLMALQRRTR